MKWKPAALSALVALTLAVSAPLTASAETIDTRAASASSPITPATQDGY